MKKNQPEAVKIVSKKFYSDLCERISASCRSINLSQSMEKACIEAVDEYIIKGLGPFYNSPAEILLVFNLLQPEINRAIARSASARLRANKRKAIKASEKKSIAETAVQDTVSLIEKPETKSENTNPTLETAAETDSENITTVAESTQSPYPSSTPSAASRNVSTNAGNISNLKLWHKFPIY